MAYAYNLAFGKCRQKFQGFKSLLHFIVTSKLVWSKRWKIHLPLVHGLNFWYSDGSIFRRLWKFWQLATLETVGGSLSGSGREVLGITVSLVASVPIVSGEQDSFFLPHAYNPIMLCPTVRSHRKTMCWYKTFIP